MTNLHVKYEDSVINGIWDNQRKPLGLPTDRPTDISKTIYPLFLEGGHKKSCFEPLRWKNNKRGMESIKTIFSHFVFTIFFLCYAMLRLITKYKWLTLFSLQNNKKTDLNYFLIECGKKKLRWFYTGDGSFCKLPKLRLKQYPHGLSFTL